MYLVVTSTSCILIDFVQKSVSCLTKGGDTLGNFAARNSCRQQIAHCVVPNIVASNKWHTFDVLWQQSCVE